MIEVRNLQKQFGAALRDVSFLAPDGAITGLLGANGAGKSTTLRTICGVLKPGGGEVRVDGGTAVKPELDSPDLEWSAWREQWQADTEVPADLRRQVERGTRNMRIMLALEVLVTVGIGGGSTIWAVMEPRTEMVVLAGAVWFFLAAAWTFARVNRRGTWSPAAMSTAEFVDLSIRRCRRKLAASRFGVWLYFAEMVFCLTFLYRDPARRGLLPAVIFGVATPLFLAGLARYRRKTRAELDDLLKLQRPEME